ncbi:MAG: hypothetical protein K940chlam7_00282 [Chlamydiae bacterium]|nr:hypothetical protein [Chlamydiota bacterium]
MQRKNLWIALALIIAGLQLAVCPQWAESAQSKEKGAKIEPLEEGLNRITLTEMAAKRLGIETIPVRSGEREQYVIPYSAVVYGLYGDTWAYTSPKPLVFVRHRINVESIDGELAFLTEGPPVGTQVVTVGVAELLGIEKGIGK